jgi:hypothetical protein
MISTRRLALAVAVGAVAIGGAIGLAACSSSSSSAAKAPSSSSTPSPAADTTASCTQASILAALPQGASMVHYDCANAGNEQWAAATVNPGNTVFFLKWSGTSWDAMTSDDVCGTASAGVPSQLLSYCGAPSGSSSSPSSSTSPAAATCTSQSILAALPGGATMEKYTCANVGGQEWAAAKVNPGNTVFFLKKNGSTWDAETAKSVCGTASAGLPSSLLAYCKA